MDEQTAIERVRTGDRDAFSVLMSLHVRGIRTYLGYKLPIPDVLDDVVQQTFVYAYLHLDEFDPGRPFFPWLKAIGWNMLRKEAQRYRRENENRLRYAERCLLESPYVKEERREGPMLEHLAACMEELSEGHRKLLDMKYRLSLASERIADKFGRTVSWVNVTIHRLRLSVKECIERRSGAAEAS